MGERVKLGLVLAAVCAVTGGGLAAVNSAVQGRIEENSRLEEARRRLEVFPAALEFEPRTVGGRRVFVAKGVGGAPLGLVVTAGPRGYAGPIGMTLGIAPDGTVAGLAISRLDQTETPGLGVKVTGAAFREQFRGKGAGAVRLKKDGGTVDAITAATISSRAVADGVREALGWYGENFPQGPWGQAGG